MKEKYHQIDETRLHRFLWRSTQMIWEFRSKDFIVEEYLSATILAQQYFTFEAYLNFLGENISQLDWSSEKNYFNENLFKDEKGTIGKFWFLSNKCQIDNKWSKGENPYQFLIKLRNIRNQLTHPKPIITEQQVFRNPLRSPKAVKNFIDLELNFKNVTLGFEIINSVCLELHIYANKHYNYDPYERNPLIGTYRILKGSSSK